MSTVQPTDKVLVNRAGTSHFAPADMSTVQDTDLLLINRAGVDYKCTFLDWKNSQTEAPDVGTVTLSDVAGGDRFTSTAFPVSATMVEDGTPKSDKKLKAYVEGALTGATTSVTPLTDQITKVESRTRTLPNFSAALKGYSGVGRYSGDVNIFAASQPNTGYIRPGLARDYNGESAGMSFAGLPGGGIMCYHSLRLYARVQQKPPTDNEFIAFNISATKYDQARQTPATPATSLSEPGLIVGDKAPIVGEWSTPTNYGWVDFPVPPGGVLLTNLVVVGLAGGGTATGGITDDMGLTAIEVDGIRLTDNYNIQETILTFASNKDLDLFNTYDTATQTDNNATGTVASTEPSASTMTFNNYLKPAQTGTWAVGQTVGGPTKTVPVKTKMYCVLNAAGAVSDLKSADPGFTAWTPSGTGPYTGTVSFPALMPSGKAPDVDMPAGTTLTVEVQASNTAGTDSAVSNTITP